MEDWKFEMEEHNVGKEADLTSVIIHSVTF